MKKVFTFCILIVSATALLAQNPYLNAERTGLANSFDTEDDVINDYMAVGHWFNGISSADDTSTISWLEEGAMKIEALVDWDYVMAKFLISPDLTETIDITNNVHISFKYKNLMPADIALVASFRNKTEATGDELLYGGEIWLEGEDVVYESSDWNTIDMDFAIEDVNIDKVVLLEIGVDGIGFGSVIIDDVVFGDYTVTNINNNRLASSEIKVFPNPADDYIRIMNAGLAFEVNIYNTIGQNVMTVKNQNQIDVSSLQKGLYFVEVAHDGGMDIFKVMMN
jgi:hypothetical protein